MWKHLLTTSLLLSLANHVQVAAFRPEIVTKRSNLIRQHRIKTFAYPDTSSLSQLSEKYQTLEQFERWRFSQELLDEEADAEMVNSIISLTLAAALRDESEGLVAEVGSPKITDEVRETIEKLLSSADANGVACVVNDKLMAKDDETLALLEKLLPDPKEDEESHKSMWDMMIQLHGREMVKLNQSAGTDTWKSVCIVARVLIYFDFLANDIPKF